MIQALQQIREAAERILDEIATAEAIEAERAGRPMFSKLNTERRADDVLPNNRAEA